MNTLRKTNNTNNMNNVIQFPQLVDVKKAKTGSIYKENGQLKPTPADPIRKTEDIQKMQKYFLENKQIRNYAIFTVGITFGLRASDLLKLRISDVCNEDFSVKSHCRIYEKKTKKFNNPSISNTAKNAITLLLGEIKELDFDDLLFQSKKFDETGRRGAVTLSQLRRILIKAAKDSGVEGHVSTHSLRKTFVYHMLQLNKGDQDAQLTVQTMLNHSSFKTTLKYCGLTQDKADEMRSGLDAFMGNQDIL